MKLFSSAAAGAAHVFGMATDVGLRLENVRLGLSQRDGKPPGHNLMPLHVTTAASVRLIRVVNFAVG